MGTPLATEVKLIDVRGMIFPPKPNDVGKIKHNATWAIVPGSVNAQKLEAAMITAAREKWKGKADDIVKQLIETRRVGFGKFEKRTVEGVIYSGFEKMWFVNTSADKQPKLKDRGAKTITPADGIIYSGCYCNVHVNAWAQDNKHGKRLNFGLMGIQFVRDGDAFTGGRVSSDDDFEDLGVVNDDNLSDFA